MAGFARDCQFNQFIKLGRGEEKSGGRNRDTILGDLFEAFLGALLLDKGVEAVKSFLYQVIGDDRGNSRGGWKQGRPKPSGTDGNRGSRVPRDSRNDRGERRDFREGRGDRRDSREGRRDFRRENPGDEREKRVPKPGTAPAQNEPPTPDNFDESTL